MSHKERQPWTGTATAVVVAPPPKSSAGAAAAARSATLLEPTALGLSQLELLYRGVSPAQPADLLALASQQGLLYSYQLPSAPSPRAPSSSDEPPNWNLLGNLLLGQVNQLERVHAAPIAAIDEALDDTQRHAVATALATQDICLIQGLPGTGKSRVIAEIVTQAAKRGDRVLLAAPHADSLDCVLEQVAQRESLYPIRCLEPGEDAARLSPTIRALTLEERAAAVRTHTLRTAGETRQAAEMQCARRRHEEPLWSQLEKLGSALAAAHDNVKRIEAKMEGIAAEVMREAEIGAGRIGGEVRALHRAGDEHLAKLKKDEVAVQEQRDQNVARLDTLAQAIAAIEPLAAAKSRGRWWSPQWWKATFRGGIVGRLKQLQAQQSEVMAARNTADKRLQELKEAHQHTKDKTAADIQNRIQTEITSRQSKLHSQIHKQQEEIQRQQTAWNDLCRQIDPESLRPASHAAEAVQAAREHWQHHRNDDDTRCAFAREWAEFLESSSDVLAARLPNYANLVAATPAALAADPNFGDTKAEGSHFDLVVLDEADQLSESDFLKVARRAGRWVLVGEPALLSDSSRAARPRTGSSHALGSNRGQSFHQLWERLHCDSSLLPHAWFREGQRLGCRLRQIAPEQRRFLENEPLADAPDVELRILAIPRARPELAEVMFPGTMAVPVAKEFLFREMQEITVQATGRGMRWVETAECISLHFSPTASDAVAITLDTGVREYLTGSHFDKTSKLEFDRSAGWDQTSVEKWIDQHLHFRHLGRTVWLDKPQRMSRDLAEVVADLIGDGSSGTEPTAAEASGTAVEFVAVTGGAKHKNQGRSDSRGPRKSDAGVNGLPATGAGLELDLASMRPGDRVPHELRGLVPGRGFINVQEARAVVKRLEDCFRTSPQENESAVGLTLAVVALYPAQAELIRGMIQQSPRLAPHAATISVGPPSAFRHREADVVLVSLTRSHSHRAVTYGEGPSALMQALTRARRQLVLIGDPGNLLRRSQWRGTLDHLDEATANREAWMIGQLVRYLQGNGRRQSAFRLCESSPA